MCPASGSGSLTSLFRWWCADRARVEARPPRQGSPSLPPSLSPALPPSLPPALLPALPPPNSPSRPPSMFPCLHACLLPCPPASCSAKRVLPSRAQPPWPWAPLPNVKCQVPSANSKFRVPRAKDQGPRTNAQAGTHKQACTVFTREGHGRQTTTDHSSWQTGKFGLGFNAVYHFTDLPSFVSGEYLVYFDPHTTFLPGASVRSLHPQPHTPHPQP